MRALKLLVVVMGVLIVAGTAAIVTVVVERAGKLGRPAAGGERPVPVPAGFRVTSTELSGDRLLVRLDGRAPGAASDEVRLMVFDLAHGASVRTVRLTAPEGALFKSGPR